MAVDIWFAEASVLQDPARFAAAYAAVSPARREKADRLRPPEAKRLSLAAGALALQALAALGVDAAAEEVALGPYGKPFLPRFPEVHFSLSHSGTRVMCVTADRPVGCDIQETAPRDLRIARRFFSREECARIFSEPTPEAQQDMFFRIWTAKESYLKCIGLGLALPLRCFSALPAADRIELTQDLPRGRFSFRTPECGPGYRCAVCIREAP